MKPLNVFLPRHCLARAALLVTFGWIDNALAQSNPDVRTLEARATRTRVAPVIDGNIQDDPAWAGVQPITGSWQITPAEGTPATERTEVRFVFTDTTLYIGAIAYDRNPDQIITADSRRDSSLTDTDSFLLIFDTYHDRQNGFV